jgi:cytochrome P450
MPSFDIMADLTFGESMGLLDTQEYSPWLQGIFDGIFYACISRAFQYFPTVWKIVQRFIPRSVHEAAEASVKHSADRVDKRLAMDGERPDIFGLVLKHETGCKMPRPEMHANADLLMIAGTETTATMLSGLTYNLLTNPGPMEKLTKEIRDSFKSADEITIDALPKLPVSRAHAAASRALLTSPVPVCLLGRGSQNVSFCWRRCAPQDKRHGCHHLRPLRAAKRKQPRNKIHPAK